jgi:glycine oxidase
MLAPVVEAHYGEEALLELNLDSARRWPAFAAEVGEAAGMDAGFRPCGSLAVAFDRDDRAELDRLAEYHRRLGLDSEPLTGADCRSREPGLSPRAGAGLAVSGDHQVDNRQLCRALLAALASAGAAVVDQPVARLEATPTAVTGVTLADGTRIDSPRVVLAAGAWSAALDGVPEVARPPVRPVKGQILRLAGPAGPPALSCNIRGLVRGSPIYLVPRADGRVVVGATQEELGFDTTTTAEGVEHLLRHALELVPGLGAFELLEATAGLRPGTPDNAPVIGPAGPDGLVIATGHFRSGILLTPVTADAVAAAFGLGPAPDAIASFGVERFTGDVGVPA